jgi:hypothetical protein
VLDATALFRTEAPKQKNAEAINASTTPKGKMRGWNSRTWN